MHLYEFRIRTTRYNHGQMAMIVFSGPDILVMLGIAVMVFIVWVICRCWREFISALRHK